MCHEDPSNVPQTFKSNHAHTQRTQSEQNQWKSNQSLLHVPEHWKHIQAQIGVSLQWIWGGIRKLTSCESEVHVSTQHSSQTLSEFDSVYTSKFTARTHATLSGAKPPSTCNYTSNKISQGNGGKDLHPVHQTSVGSRSPKTCGITQHCQYLTVLHSYAIDPKERTQRWA